MCTCCQGTGSLQRTCRGKGRGSAARLVGTLYRRPRRSTPGAGYELYAPSESKQRVTLVKCRSCLLCNEQCKRSIKVEEGRVVNAIV